MIEDETPDLQAHLQQPIYNGGAHSYPPQPTIETPHWEDLPSNIPDDPPQTMIPAPSQAFTFTAQAKRAMDTSLEEDNANRDHPVALKVRLVAQNDLEQKEAMKKQEDSIATILKRLEGLQTEVSYMFSRKYHF